MRVPLGDFKPDVAETDTDVVPVASNVLPGPNCYYPARAGVAVSAALAEAPRGLYLAQRQDGSFVPYAGDPDQLFVFNQGTSVFDSIGSGYSLTADHLWSMRQFGTTLIATNINNVPQKANIETAGAASALGGSPPKARNVAVVDDYVVLAGLFDDPFALQWSATNDAEGWTPGTGNSDIQSFPDGGRVMGVADAARVVVQEQLLRRMIPTPGGSSGPFQFEKIDDSHGTIAPYSIIPYGSSVAYLAQDDFYFANEPIGRDSITDWFFARANDERLFSVLGAFDPAKPYFYFAYRTGATPHYDEILVYNWRRKRWAGPLSLTTYAIAAMASPGYTLEGLDAPYPDIDTLVPASLDSSLWLGGRPAFGIIDADFKLAFTEGATLAATFETAERELIPGYRATTSGVRPFVDSAAATIAVGTRERFGDARVWAAAGAQTRTGLCPVKSGGRLHRFRLETPAGAEWTKAEGLDAMFYRAGRR